MGLPAWDLGDLFKDFSSAKQFLKVLGGDVAKFEKKYSSGFSSLNSGEFLAAVREYEKIVDGLNRLGTYAYLAYVTQMDVADVCGFYQFISEEIAVLSAKIAFVNLEANKIPSEKMDLMMRESADLAFFKPFFEQIRIFKPYELSRDVEQILIKKSVTSSGGWNRFFDETLASFGFKIDGKEYNIAKTLDMLSNRDGDVRRKAAKELGRVLGENSRVFGYIMNMIIKDHAIETEERGFKTPVSSRNLANFIEDDVVDGLVEAVRANFGRTSHRYYKLKAKIFGKDKLKYWDRNAPLPFSDDKTYSYDEAKATVLEAYRKFSPTFAEIGELFFEKNWIDAAPKNGKDSGAFSHPAAASCHPYIMLNFLGKARDVATLAHELGHGVHQYLARKQGALMAGTPLTLAETASVFGEQLCFQSLLAAQMDKKKKIAIIAEKVEDMLNTVVRQVAFFTFEKILHDERKNGELSAELIAEVWMKVQRESLGEAIEFEPEYGNFWAYISHFIHAPFYVYAYAFGDCLVNSLYAVYRSGKVQNFEEKYITMLEAGGTLHHKTLLEPFGLDVSSDGFWQGGLDVIASYIDELEKLLEEVNFS